MKVEISIRELNVVVMVREEMSQITDSELLEQRKSKVKEVWSNFQRKKSFMIQKGKV